MPSNDWTFIDELADIPEELWIQLPRGRFLCTKPYLQGALAAREMYRGRAPYPPGPAYAQYVYGYHNEQAGHHDNITLPCDPE